MTYIKNSCLILFCLSSLWLHAQNTTISGNISTADETPIANVTITVTSGEFTATTISNAEGNYTFEEVSDVENLTFELEKNTDPLNGVSTIDYVLGARHILGVAPFETANQYIAMDINGSGSITAFDLIQLKQLVLGIIEVFPNTDSWQFLENSIFDNIEFNQNASTEYTVDTNIFYSINNLSDDPIIFNFTGIKIGDANGNATTN